MRKFFLVPAVLSLAFLLMATDFAQAQRRGGGSRGGGGGSRGGSRNSVRINVGSSYGYRSSGYYGYRSGGYYGPYRYGYSPYQYGYGYPRRSYYAPTAAYVQPVAVDRTDIRVIVPDPAANVWFNDRLTQQRGTERLFRTPSIGASATFRIRASWNRGGREVVQEQMVTVLPGQPIVVDFTRPTSEPLAPPK